MQWVQQQHLNEHRKRDLHTLLEEVLEVYEKKAEEVLPPDETGDDDKPLYFNDPLFPKQWYLVSLTFLKSIYYKMKHDF